MVSKKIQSLCQPYILPDSIHTILLKWQNCRNGEQIGGCRKLRRKWGWEGSWYDYKWATCGILVVIEMFYILRQYTCLHLLIHFMNFLVTFFKLKKFSKMDIQLFREVLSVSICGLWLPGVSGQIMGNRVIPYYIV